MGGGSTWFAHPRLRAMDAPLGDAPSAGVGAMGDAGEADVHLASMAASTVLIADDDAGHRSVLDMLLSLDGHEVVAVGNGREALEWLREHTPDVAILDVNMPHVGGIDVCDRMRKVSRLRSVPVIILTALRDERTRTLAKMAKADLVVAKPLEGKDFRATVSQLIAGGREPGTP